jgi:hypothetical protein
LASLLALVCARRVVEGAAPLVVAAVVVVEWGAWEEEAAVALRTEERCEGGRLLVVGCCEPAMLFVEVAVEGMGVHRLE